MPTSRCQRAPLAHQRATAWSRRSERGAAALEFAIVLPVLGALLLGIVTTGLSMASALGVVGAVREGARFGATGDASSTTWLADTVSRVRTTQLESSSSTAVCVQLWKQGTGEVKLSCSPAVSGPTLSMPAATAYPKVPDGLTDGTCVVRVVAARPYTINAVLFSHEGTMTRGAVARYERSSC